MNYLALALHLAGAGLAAFLALFLFDEYMAAAVWLVLAFPAMIWLDDKAPA